MATKKRRGASAEHKAKKRAKKQQQQQKDNASDQSDADVEMTVDAAAQAKQKDDDNHSEGEPLLSAELREELGGVEGDMMVIVGKKKKKDKADVVEQEFIEEATKMSRSKRKKLEHLAVPVARD